ncbi:hypothetical protein [Streptomyces sp. NPDC057623]
MPGSSSPRPVGPLLFQRFVLSVHLDSDMVANAVDTALTPWLPHS